MGSIYRYSFTVGKDTDIFPVYLSIAEGGPAMALALLDPVIPCPFLGSYKKKLASIRVIKAFFFLAFDLVKKRGVQPVSRILCIMSVEVLRGNH